MDPIPGSFLSQLSALASPGTFIWSRLIDEAMSLGDTEAVEICVRVERWALDEVPLSAKLLQQVAQWLYRDNRFYQGTLQIGERIIGPASLRVPTLAVINKQDEVAPEASVLPMLEAMPGSQGRLIEHSGEPGVGLHHLSILIGKRAFSDVWPEIISWIYAMRQK